MTRSVPPAAPAERTPPPPGWVRLPIDPAAAVAAGRLVPPQPLPPPVELQAWWQPTDGTPRAGVLVLPEVFGINDWVRSVTRRLARAGYASLAVPLFSRTAPGLELDYSPASLQQGRSHKERTTAAGLLLDVATAAAWLEGQLGQRGGLGCIGFCFGGHVALLAALLPAIAASCDCYGAGVVSGRPGGGPPSLALLPSIGGRLLCLCGREDPLLPQADVAALRQALAACGRHPPHTLVELQAGHGFLCDQRLDHRPQAAAQAWELILEFFAENLG